MEVLGKIQKGSLSYKRKKFITIYPKDYGALFLDFKLDGTVTRGSLQKYNPYNGERKFVN